MERIIALFGNQNSPLNQVQIDEARSFLTPTYGNYCGAGADNGEGCHKTVDELLTLFKAKYLMKNQPIPRREHPILVINEKMGYGLHRTINGKFDYCGNVNYFCKSCNMIYDRRTGDVRSDERTTFTARKSHEVRPKFKNKLRDHLTKHVEICYKACINKWSGLPSFKCSQETLENAFNQEYDVSFDLVEKEDYDIICNYPKCNGEHIILKGLPPTVRQTDFEAFSKELDEHFINKTDI